MHIGPVVFISLYSRYLRQVVRMTACLRRTVDQPTIITTTIIIAAAGAVAEVGEVWWSDFLLSRL